MPKIVLQLDKIGKEDLYLGRGNVSTFRKGQPTIISEINATHIPLLDIFNDNISNVEDLLKAGIYIVGSVKELGGVDKDKYRYVYCLGYHVAGDGGGGLFAYYSNIDVSNHDGGIYIDPDKISSFPTAWSDLQQQVGWFQPNTVGSGVWVRCCGEEISVKYFGAKGDNITNDIISFKQAFYKTGCTIVIPKGTYWLSGTYSIEILDNTIINGCDGAVLVVNNSFTGDRLFYANNRKNIKINGLRFSIPSFPSLSGALAGIISLSDCANVTVSNCKFDEAECVLGLNRYIFINSCKNAVIENNVLPYIVFSSKYVGNETYRLENVSVVNNIFYVGVMCLNGNSSVVGFNFSSNKLANCNYNLPKLIRFESNHSEDSEICICDNSFYSTSVSSVFDIYRFNKISIVNNKFINFSSYTISDVIYNNKGDLNICDNYIANNWNISITLSKYSTTANQHVNINNNSFITTGGNISLSSACKIFLMGNNFNSSGTVGISINRECVVKNNCIVCNSAFGDLIVITDNINSVGGLDISDNDIYVYSGAISAVISLLPSTYNFSKGYIVGNVLRLFGSATATNFINTSTTVVGCVVMRNICQGISSSNIVTGAGTNIYVALNHNGTNHEPSGYNTTGYTIGTYTETRTGINSSMTVTTANNVICTLLTELKAMGILK